MLSNILRALNAQKHVLVIHVVDIDLRSLVLFGTQLN
jgi:hypothetical protein